MELGHGIHLGYCTNIHRGETWADTFDALKNYTLRVKQQVCPDRPYGIGLRLSAEAAEAFLGTQGYIWDTQSDMLWALCGGILALLMLSKLHDRQINSLNGVNS